MASQILSPVLEGTKVNIKPNFENIAWKWMRYSAILLIPLVWIHVILQDILVGVHRINLDTCRV